MTVLFSPVGTRDPIANFHDGAMLHILRCKKPDKVVLYLSEYVLNKHKEDNRYIETITWLGQDLSHHFDIEVIERPGLDQVHKQDVFYRDFENILDDLLSRYNGIEKVYLNISSGTPAMKQALSVISVLRGDIFAQVQVSKPEFVDQSDKDLHNVEYDGRKTYEDNMDNSVSFTNRCIFPTGNYLAYKIQEKLLYAHLDSHDYEAAKVVGKYFVNYLSSSFMDLLNGAIARQQLSLKEAGKLLRDAKSFDLLNYSDQGLRALTFEGVLQLQSKLHRKQYGDFLRYITPVFLNLILYRLEKKHRIHVSDFAERRNGLIWKDSPASSHSHRNIISSVFKKNAVLGGRIYVSANNLLPLLEKLENNSKLYRNFEELREIEMKIRNIAAHELQEITPKWIRTMIEKTEDQIMSLIKAIAEEIELIDHRSDWASYNKMNERIKDELVKIDLTVMD